MGMRRREDIYMQLQVNEARTSPFRAIAAPLFEPPKEPPLPAAPGRTWQSLRATATEPWHAWMDARIEGIVAYEREATAARDEAARHRSTANAVRRGDLARVAEQRDSWERSRATWSDDAREHLRQAEQLDAQARDWERAPLQLLRAAPARLFALYRERRAEHRAAQRAFIVAHPGAIPDARLRITWLSRLLLAEPALDVAAYVDRTVRELADADRHGGSGRSGQRGSGDGARSERRSAIRVAVPPGAVLNPDAAHQRLRGLAPGREDQRSVEEVLAQTMPFVPMTTERHKPVFDREERV